MKILMVNTYYYPNMIGGTEQSIKLLAEGLVECGHDVFVLAADKTNTSREEINGVKVIRLNLKYNNYLPRSVRKILEFNNIAMSNKIRDIFEEIKPDIIHTNNLFYISPLIWKLASSMNIKIVHTIRDYWGICPKTTLLDRNNHICRNKKKLCKMHHYNYKSFTKNVDFVTAPSKFTLDLYKEEDLFVTTPGCVIPNAIDIDLKEHNEIITLRKKRQSDCIKFLFIGSLHEHKGIRFLIETFMSIENDNIKLIICGDGPLKDFVREKCEIDKRISFLGTVFKEDKDKVLKSCDIMIIPSIWYEPFGRVVIEAYKYGLPVIACKIGGINELLQDTISIGVEANNSIDLKEAILKFINRETVKKYLKDMENNLINYDLDEQIKSFNKIYMGLVNPSIMG